MLSDKNPFLSLFIIRNLCRGYLLESPGRGDSNKYPRHIFLGILNSILFNFSSTCNSFHLALRFRSIQIVIITSFVVISDVDIKRVDCNIIPDHCGVRVAL